MQIRMEPPKIWRDQPKSEEVKQDVAVEYYSGDYFESVERDRKSGKIDSVLGSGEAKAILIQVETSEAEVGDWWVELENAALEQLGKVSKASSIPKSLEESLRSCARESWHLRISMTE